MSYLPNKKFILILFLLALVGGFFAVQHIHQRYQMTAADLPPVPVPELNAPSSALPSVPDPESEPTPELPAIKPDAHLSVPFTPQAPTGNWVGIYKEGCEEASAIMVHEYFSGNDSPTLDSDFVLDEIKRLADWEMEHFGYNLDINTPETAEMIQKTYGLQTEIRDDFTETDLKRLLSEGKLIILPANGQLLKNPYFRQPGPPYHMLVIKGYDSTGFVTNDPGTRRGKDFVYDFDTLHAASGEWSHETESVDTGQKMVLVVWKN